MGLEYREGDGEITKDDYVNLHLRSQPFAAFDTGFPVLLDVRDAVSQALAEGWTHITFNVGVLALQAPYDWRLNSAYAKTCDTGCNGDYRKFKLTIKPTSCPVICDRVEQVKVRCHQRGKRKSDITTTVFTSLNAGTVLTLTREDDDPRKVKINRHGKGKTKWKGVAEGSHEICIRECEDVCQARMPRS